MKVADYRQLNCAQCIEGEALGFDFTMAFQPIIDINKREVFAQEALVRGLDNTPATEVFKHVTQDNLYRFDQTCRVKAIQLAAQLNIDTYLSINFMPRAVYRPELCIRTTLLAAEDYGFPVQQIIFECTEGEQVDTQDHLINIVRYYQKQGFMTAIDDFGAGYSGLNLLAEFKTDLIKLDMALIRDVDRIANKQAIIRGMLQICRELDIRVIAEGVESRDELLWLADAGIGLFQGYYFARPAFRALAPLPPDELFP